MTNDRPILAKLFQREYFIGQNEHGEWQETAATQELADLDQQVRQWVADTGSELVSASPPGYHLSWLNNEKTLKHVIVGVTLLYRPAVVPPEKFRVTQEPAHDSQPSPVEERSGAAARAESDSRPGRRIRKEIIL